MPLFTFASSPGASFGSLALAMQWIIRLGLFGVVGALIVVFNPLIIGLLRTLVLIFRQLISVAEQVTHDRSEGAHLLERMARQFDATQPNQAAELRWLASRD